MRQRPHTGSGWRAGSGRGLAASCRRHLLPRADRRRRLCAASARPRWHMAARCKRRLSGSVTQPMRPAFARYVVGLLPGHRHGRPIAVAGEKPGTLAELRHDRGFLDRLFGTGLAMMPGHRMRRQNGPGWPAMPCNPRVRSCHPVLRPIGEQPACHDRRARARTRPS